MLPPIKPPHSYSQSRLIGLQRNLYHSLLQHRNHKGVAHSQPDLGTHPWLFPTVDRERAEKLLVGAGLVDGIFLLRPSSRFIHNSLRCTFMCFLQRVMLDQILHKFYSRLSSAVGHYVLALVCNGSVQSVLVKLHSLGVEVNATIIQNATVAQVSFKPKKKEKDEVIIVALL